MSADWPSLKPATARARHSLTGLLLRIVDGGVAATLFFAPLFMGGRHPVGRLVFVSLVSVITVAWCARQCLLREPRWTGSGAEPLLLAGLALLVLQITPLSPSLLLALSPCLGKLLPLWTAGEESFRLAAWSQLSLTPQATREAAAMYVAYALLFLVTIQRLRTLHDLRRVLCWLALAAVAMAVLGLVQFLFGNGRYLWIYEDPFRDTAGVVKGPFFNENHFAHFLALGIGPLIWWLWRAHRAVRRPLPEGGIWRGRGGADRREQPAPGLVAALPVGLGIVTLAGLLTFSRGGVFALLTAGAVALAPLAALGLIGKRLSAILLGKLALLLVALLIFGFEPLTKEWKTLEQSRSLHELSQGRWALWKAHGKIIHDFPLVGTGIGSHRQIYPTYLDEHFDVTFWYGESGFMQVLVEAGIPGLVLVLAGIAWSVWWCVRVLCGQPWRSGTGELAHDGPKRDRLAAQVDLQACAAALLSGIVASVVHSLFDFVWYIPACMTLTVITLASACRTAQLACWNWEKEGALVAHTPRGGAAGSGDPRRAREGSSVPGLQYRGRSTTRRRWLVATAAGLAGCASMIHVHLPPALAARHWDAYVRATQPAKDDRVNAKRLEDYRSRIARLNAVLERHPRHAEAHWKLAGLYLQQFEIDQQHSPNQMPLGQIGDAAWTANFPSAEARGQWLARVCGPNLNLLYRALGHACRAVQLCPLQGEAYVYLGELDFLGRENRAHRRAYVQQALRVRPHAGPVLLAAGAIAAWDGDPTTAMRLWKRAFHTDEQTRRGVIEVLAPRVPAEFLVDQFMPDVDGLALLYAFYRQHERDTDARTVGKRYVTLLERRASEKVGQPAAEVWYEAWAVNTFLGNRAAALHCIRQAATAKPTDLTLRQMLAQQLLNEHDFDRAIDEIQWCLRREPNNAKLRALLSDAHRQRWADTSK